MEEKKECCVMKKMRWSVMLLYATLFFLLPVICVFVFQKDKKITWDGQELAESCLPGLLYEVTSDKMHFETIKAMAVLVRTNTQYELEHQMITYDMLKSQHELSVRYLKEKEIAFYETLVRACEETEGEMVFYEDELCRCPYFYSSSGVTRDAYEIFQNDSYPYLTAVPSYKDQESSSYITYHYFSSDRFSEMMDLLSDGTFHDQIQILEKDAAGYITWLKVGDAVVGGEVFREALGLSSSDFKIEQAEEDIRITCKGQGHGFGFSLYGSDAMADEKDYKEMIAYYFHNISIEQCILSHSLANL